MVVKLRWSRLNVARAYSVVGHMYLSDTDLARLEKIDIPCAMRLPVDTPFAVFAAMIGRR